MAQANDSILVTPGTGATVATHLANSKEHQAIVTVDHNGHLQSDPDGVYVTTAAIMAKAASKCYISLYVTAATATIVDILGVYLVNEVTVAVTGLVRGYRLYRVTAAPTLGTVGAPVKLLTATSAALTNVTVRANGPTVTVSGEALAVASVYEDEAAGGEGRIWLWKSTDLGFPITLVAGEGIAVTQDATAGAGVLSVSVIFRVR